MRTRPVTYREAADLLTKWADRCVPHEPTAPGIDFTLEEACDRFCAILADDPYMDLSDAPASLKKHLRARIMYSLGVCALRAEEIIGDFPAAADDDTLLAALIGVQLAGTRLPPEWRYQ